MTRHARGFEKLVDDFLGHRHGFWAFHGAFIARWTHLPPDTLEAAERAAWNEVYTWVLCSVPDPVGAADRNRGVMGEGELRECLRLLHPPEQR